VQFEPQSAGSPHRFGLPPLPPWPLDCHGFTEIVIQAQDAKGWDDVLAKILVLVVAPDHHQVRVERIERLADRAEIVGIRAL
jgi:hypothetical protein